MHKKYKWEIKDLSAAKSFKISAKIVLEQRIKSSLAAVRKFFNEETPENLHEIRIALRRLRYNMEVFVSCFDRETFIAFYQSVERLQDMTGVKRDLDVLEENVKSLSGGGIESEKLVAGIVEKKDILKDELTIELMKFMHGSELKDFYKQIL